MLLNTVPYNFEMTPLRLEDTWLVHESNNNRLKMDCDSSLKAAQEPVKKTREELTRIFPQFQDEQVFIKIKIYFTIDGRS